MMSYFDNQLRNSFCKVGININTIIGTAIIVMIKVRKGNGSMSINCLPNSANIEVING